jgi:hypothetical protein
MSLRQKSRTASALPRIATIGYNPTTYHMSILFHKRTKKILQWVWGVIAIMVALGMVIFFSPGLTNWLLS